MYRIDPHQHQMKAGQAVQDTRWEPVLIVSLSYAAWRFIFDHRQSGEPRMGYFERMPIGSNAQ